MEKFKSGFVSIIGRTNVGKSTLINSLVGEKVAIMANKTQTTRTAIKAIMNRENCQIIITDTPGIHKPKTKLGEKMIKSVDDAISGVDSCLFVTESKGEIRPTEIELLERLKKEKIPVILAINKIDMLSKKEELMERILELSKLC